MLPLLASDAVPSFFRTGLISYPKKSLPGGRRSGCGPFRRRVRGMPLDAVFVDELVLFEGVGASEEEAPATDVDGFDVNDLVLLDALSLWPADRKLDEAA